MEMIKLFNVLMECMVTGLFAALFLVLFDVFFGPKDIVIVQEGSEDE